MTLDEKIGQLDCEFAPTIISDHEDYKTFLRQYPLGIVLTTASFAQPEKSFNARDYGARGDGGTKDTAAIQKAIDACTQAGGGTVQLPAGTYLSGSIYLKDNVGNLGQCANLDNREPGSVCKA